MRGSWQCIGGRGRRGGVPTANRCRDGWCQVRRRSRRAPIATAHRARCVRAPMAPRPTVPTVLPSRSWALAPASATVMPSSRATSPSMWSEPIPAVMTALRCRARSMRSRLRYTGQKGVVTSTSASASFSSRLSPVSVVPVNRCPCSVRNGRSPSALSSVHWRRPHDIIAGPLVSGVGDVDNLHPEPPKSPSIRASGDGKRPTVCPAGLSGWVPQRRGGVSGPRRAVAASCSSGSGP